MEEEEKRRKEEEERRKEEEKRKREEEEKRKRKEEKESLILRQKMLRINNNKNNNNNINELTKMQSAISFSNNDSKKNEEINQILEDMCIYGNIVKKEIEDETEKNPNKYIPKTQALKSEEVDKELFVLGLLSQNLEQLGIKTVIEKGETNSKNDDEYITNLQFIINGLCDKKKYTLKFDFGEEKNEELLYNKEKYEIFKNNLKRKISRDYNIPIEKIIVTYPQRGSFEVQLIFQDDEFNELNMQEFINKFKNEQEFPLLKELKEIHEDVIIGGCKLTKAQLDSRGNRSEGWGVNEKRGGKEYKPPIGWTGIGLKVMDRFENNIWIGMNNSPGEWCVAYHGVGNGQQSEKVKKISGLIYNGGFKPGKNQGHEGCDDLNHRGEKVKKGVYCTPNIEKAEGYAGISKINGKDYKTVLMVRVDPVKIRYCNCQNQEYWVVSGSTSDIRPYRILYKKC